MLDIQSRPHSAPAQQGGKPYRFFLIAPFHLPQDSSFLPLGQGRAVASDKPKEEQLFNYENLKDLLADVDWDFHPGPLAP
ncbi:MAG: hypothetical protein IT538_12500, partial [Variibacter sp.]|nr:hypothetical protein [Variibacter sp.]